MRKKLYFVLMLVSISCLVLISLLIFPRFFTRLPTPTSTSLEYVISQRRSFHAGDAAWDKSIPISSDLMKTVCKNAFSSGFNLSGMALYWANSTACYQYDQTTNSFVLHAAGDKRPQLASDVNQRVDNAPCIIIIVWDSQTEIDHFVASRKSGFIVQNLYLVAVRNNLGGCCVGAGMYREDVTANIQAHLSLAPNLKPMYLFPIGFLKAGFSYSTGNLTKTSGNLPSPLESERNISDVFNEKKDLATAFGDTLSQQKLSNLLWSMYGYSLLGTGHRTVPTSYGVYPFQMYVCNGSGTYDYTASTHSLSKINSIDKRETIVANAETPTYMNGAPALIVVCWNSLGGSSNASDSDSKGRFINTNVGCCFQNLYLSANVWNISVSEIAYTTNYEALRNNISDPLPSYVYPMYLVGVGEPNGTHSLNLHVKDWDLTNTILPVASSSTKKKSSREVAGWRVQRALTISPTGSP